MEEKIIKEIKATMAIEGNILQSSDVELINSFLRNEITEKQGIEIIKNEFKNIN